MVKFCLFHVILISAGARSWIASPSKKILSIAVAGVSVRNRHLCQYENKEETKQHNIIQQQK